MTHNLEGTTFKAEHEGETETHTVERVNDDELVTTRPGSSQLYSWPRSVLEEEDTEIVEDDGER